MRVSDVDRSATRGDSPGHRISPVSKLVAFGFVILAVIVNQNVLVITGVALLVAAAAVAWRLPGRTIAPLAAYPAFFALVFAWASAPDALSGALFVAKAVTVALAGLVLMLTTPYPQVFAPVQRIVPAFLGDAMLMTYRSFFLAAEKFEHLLIAVKLRSGLHVRAHPLRAARVSTQALGGLLLYSFDLSQRTYDVMRLRGYEGRLRVGVARSAHPSADAALLFAALTAAAVAVAFRVGWQQLNPYSWMVPLAGLAAVGIAMLYRSFTSPERSAL